MSELFSKIFKAAKEYNPGYPLKKVKRGNILTLEFNSRLVALQFMEFAKREFKLKKSEISRSDDRLKVIVVK